MTKPKKNAEGVGIGLRVALADELFERAPSEVSWLEIHPENYVGRGGRFRFNLERAQESWAVVPHGLTCCLGSTAPHDPKYTRELRDFLREIDAPWYSDHLCFGGVDGVMLHDLLPLPFTREAIGIAVERIAELQDAIEVPVALENVSYYGALEPPTMTEWEFVGEVLEQADCALLLDVNNIFVNSVNHGFDPREYVDAMPLERVVQIHVAGHWVRPDGWIIDTHSEAVRQEVYDLLEYTLKKLGPCPVLLERDGNYPPLDELLAEVRQLNEVYERATGSPAAASPEAGSPETEATAPILAAPTGAST